MRRLMVLAAVGLAGGCSSFDDCDSGFSPHSHHRHRRTCEPPVCETAPRGWLGVSMQNLNCELSRRFGYPNECGIFIDYALPGGPSAGVLRGADILMDIDGCRTGDMSQFERILGSLPPGRVATLHIWRDARCETVAVTLGEMPLEFRAHPGRRTYYTTPPCSD